MASAKISIIVPVFNASKTLIRCIDSILLQTYQEFELLLINDGSTDSSAGICEKYAAKDKRIRYFFQVNGGVSAARNKGLDNATGNFIAFVDSDDYLDKEYLEAFFHLDSSPNDALVIQGFIKEFQSGFLDVVAVEERVYHPTDFSDFFHSLKFIRKMPFPFAKLFDAKIINEKQIRFNINVHYGEDLIFILDYLQYVHTIIVVNSSLYHYIKTDGSLSYRLNSYESEIERFNIVKSQLDSLHARLGLNEQVVAFHKSYITRYLIRAFSSLYISPNKKHRRDRLAVMEHHLVSDSFELINKYFTPRDRKGNVFKFLFRHKLLPMIDAHLLFTINLRLLKAKATSRKRIVW